MSMPPGHDGVSSGSADSAGSAPKPPPGVLVPRLLRDLAPQVRAAVVRRFCDFAASEDAVAPRAPSARNQAVNCVSLIWRSDLVPIPTRTRIRSRSSRVKAMLW